LSKLANAIGIKIDALVADFYENLELRSPLKTHGFQWVWAFVHSRQVCARRKYALSKLANAIGIKIKAHVLDFYENLLYLALRFQ